MQYTKEDAIRIVVSCANAYQKELENRMLLFVCADKHGRLSFFEFSFPANNFLHLTGLRLKQKKAENNTDAGKSSTISPSVFYEKCLNSKLSPEDFEFSEDGTTTMKLDILPSIIKKNLSANMIGDFNSLRPKLYTEKLAGGTKGCMGFVKDSMSGNYVPNTVLKEDIRNVVFDYVKILITYRKYITDEKYVEIVYAAKKTDWTNISLPTQYAYLPFPTETSKSKS